MPDGRRIEVLSFGDPAGRPVIWMQSTYGFCRLPRAAEADLARRGLKVLLPFRAGWCGSDPLPKGRNPFEVAVADMRALMLQLRIASAVVVAPGDDIRIALMLAQADPARVRAIFGIGCGFPILNDAQYRRLIPVARFVRACARYSPKVLPFMLRGLRATVARYGFERYMRGTLARIPADARAFADPEIAAAFLAGAEKLFFAEPFSEAARRRARALPSGLAGGPRPRRLPGDADPRRAGRQRPVRDRARLLRHVPRLALHRLPRRGRVRRPRPLARRCST